ncbi:MAG: CDP-diacylglycerol--serine O-phosphatidyltransferase [Euryarchaeota archaeon RBG_16_68_12]|nr:MAG: CDP-diacylglycerol--serine O-phosphatidyltransferase [Euryarchaeota archaeon RBG_16_68_12]
MAWVRKISIADMITLGNALVGFLAITYVIDGAWLVASMLILLGVALDGLDGLAARRFGSKHNRGQYLDSFSDTISFCIAPALLVYGVFYIPARGSAWTDPMNALAVVASTLIASFGILRLARFVQMDYTKESFLGFPTPANALLVVALVDLFAASTVKTPALFDASIAILLVMISAAVLMISNVPYPKIGDALRVPLTLGALVFAAVATVAYLVVQSRVTVEAVVFTLLLLSAVAYVLGGPLYVRRTRSADEVLPVH